jgi:hypothetical protein
LELAAPVVFVSAFCIVAASAIDEFPLTQLAIKTIAKKRINKFLLIYYSPIFDSFTGFRNSCNTKSLNGFKTVAAPESNQRSLYESA